MEAWARGSCFPVPRTRHLTGGRNRETNMQSLERREHHTDRGHYAVMTRTTFVKNAQLTRITDRPNAGIELNVSAWLSFHTVIFWRALCTPIEVCAYIASPKMCKTGWKLDQIELPCRIAKAITALYVACMRAAVAVELDRHRRSVYSVPMPKKQAKEFPSFSCERAQRAGKRPQSRSPAVVGEAT